MGPLGGALIKAGGSLVGGLLGKDAPKPSAMVVSHLKGVREGAERYGFNPLAVLGAVGGPTMGQAPANYMGAAIADAFGGIADAYTASAEDEAEKQRLEAENEELRRKVNFETIRPENPGLFEKPRGLGVVSTTTGGPRGWVSEYEADFVGNRVRERVDGGYDMHNPARTTVMMPFGETTPAQQSDAEDFEKRYGDPVSWIVGVGNLAADAGASLRTATDTIGLTKPDEWVLPFSDVAENLADYSKQKYGDHDWQMDPQTGEAYYWKDGKRVYQ